jgi:hypothetical protein
MGYLLALVCGLAMIVLAILEEPVHVVILLIGIVLALAGAI